MWNVIVCDEDDSFAERVGTKLFEFYDPRGFDILVRLYSNGTSLLHQFDRPLHLIVMNTRYRGKLVCSLARQIHSIHPKAHIIFYSENDNDVFETVKYHPYAFIRKSRWEEELICSLNNLWENEHRGRYVHVRQNRKNIALLVDEIMYLESDGHYVDFHCPDHVVYRTREKLPYYHKLLEPFYFMQPSKGYLVNCMYIHSCANPITLTNGERISCAKSRYRATMEYFERYLREMKATEKFL